MKNFFYIIAVAILVTIICLGGKNKHVHAIYSDYCITWKRAYLVPYKYTGFLPPRHNYIKNIDDYDIDIEINFIATNELLIIVSDIDAYEIHLEDFAYTVDTICKSTNRDSYQFRYQINTIDAFANPVVCERLKDCDTCYFVNL